MSTKTWTHVDRLVRDLHDEMGMLPTGTTDAEIAHAFIGWLRRERDRLAGKCDDLDCANARLKIQLEKAQQAPKESKTKVRLKALEAAVALLQQKPVYGPRGQCRVHGCADPAVTPDGLCNGHFE